MNVIEPMNFYEKEVRFYQEAADLSPIGTPRVHAAVFDPASRDFVILLEDLSGRRMCDQNAGCAVDDAFVAVRALAEHHAQWWESERFASMPWLPVIADPPFPQVIAGMFKQAWPVAQEILGPRLGDRYVEFGDRFVDLVDWFTAEGSLGPVTYCHGDYRLDNLFFANGGGDRPITVVDWQLSFRGRGGYDLAYFISQSLGTEDRRANEQALIDHYRADLAGAGIDYPENELRKDYGRTVAFCFCYPVISAGQIEFTNERHRELIEGMLDRAKSAIDDVDALALLPG
jgi:aminoglycoside/choline kinase family phosphotransferase